MISPMCPFCDAGRLRLKFPPQVYECDSCRVGTLGPARLICAVPFCARTRGQRKGDQPIREGEEWICGDHWRLVPRRLKAISSRARRKGRPSAALGRLWARCKRAAIERAMGVA